MLKLAVRELPHGTRRAYGLKVSSLHTGTLETPGLDDFPEFLKAIETKWKTKLLRRFERERFAASRETESSQKLPRYILSMFPYPSGRLHLGHVRIYTSGDILARYSKLMAKNEGQLQNFSHVINPMGFDSFGLPAENAARERGLSPADWTNSNIRSMKKQLDDLALLFDWREATSNPSYYKWTQELFLSLMESNLVYKSYAPVNWDPVDKTVLADEQVDDEGRSWRSGALVVKRNLRQWFIKVNAFTKDIYDAHEVDPDTWRDILAIQRNWIGKPCGWLFYLPVSKNDSRRVDVLPVFTKTPELFTQSGTKLLISNDHWLESIYGISNSGYINNPFTGKPLEVELTKITEDLPPSCQATLLNRSEASTNSSSDLMRQQVLLKAGLNNLGGFYTSDKYRDWLVSRQRFWGTPIPAIQCENCNNNRVSRDSLPVVLPKFTTMIEPGASVGVEDHEILAPLKELAPKEWLHIDCPSCGSQSKRECETLDTLFDSSWYFLRYASEPSNERPYDLNRVQPVWCYIGGKEHASMHLFYARFMTHFLHSTKRLHFREPFKKLLVQGVVKSLTYKLNGRYLTQSEVNNMLDKSAISTEFEKMSKSKGNGVDPQNLLDSYGIDATRFCLMSYVNPRTERLWRGTEEEFKDVLLFLRRAALTVQEYFSIGHLSTSPDKVAQITKVKELNFDELNHRRDQLKGIRNRCTIDAIYHIQETNQFRQYISVLHTLLTPLRTNLKNSLVFTSEYAELLAALLVMLNPLTPHFSEELWSHFSKSNINPLTKSTNSPYKLDLQVSDQAWPLPDSDYPLQIKVRATNSDEHIEKLSITKEQLRCLSNSDIAELVEKHFKSNEDGCRVVEVQKYDDLMAVVQVNLDSNSRDKYSRKKKKKTHK